MPSVNEMLDRFVAERLPRLNERTRNDYGRHIVRLREYFGTKDLRQVTRHEINQFMDVPKGKIQRNRNLAVLSAAYTEALKWGWAEGNPCSYIHRHESKRDDRDLTEQEFEAAKQMARSNPRLAVAMDLVRHTGQMQSYVLSLLWTQVHEHEIRFRHHKSHKPIPVPITPRLREILAECRRLSPESKFVVATRHGNRYTGEGFRAMHQRFSRAWERAGYERFTFHDLVHLARREPKLAPAPSATDPLHAYPQFAPALKADAAINAPYYKLFFCLEQSIRARIAQTMERAVGADWWESDKIQQSMRQEVTALVTREVDSAMTQRSMRMIDYTTFGQLGQIIRDNWDLFEKQFTSKGAVSNVLARLNLARGPIAHCCPLSALEIERLGITVQDWFNILKAP